MNLTRKKNENIMIIIKFRGKYICLNNIELGCAAFIATIGVMYLLERYRERKKRGRISKCLNNTLTFRGGGIFLREFLRKRSKKGKQYEVINLRLTRYIRELKNSLDSKEILYIDLELLAYAIKTMNRPKPSELVMGSVVRIVNPVRTISSVVIGSTAGVIVKLVANSHSVIGSIVFIMVLYTSPYHPYSNNLLSDLPVNNENIEYILKEPEVGKILVSVDECPPECKVYQIEGRTFTSKDSESVVVEHKPAKREYKFNTRTRTLKDLNITVDDYTESEEDAAYVRSRIKEREAMRIRMNTKTRDSE